MLPKNKFLRFISILCVLAFTPRAEALELNQIKMPTDMSKLDFELLTVDMGPDLYMRFGHSILRVHDRENKMSYDLNWGVFDFEAPNFALNFFKGIQIYTFTASSINLVPKVYGQMEKRTVWIDRLNFSTSQKKRLMERIVWNTKEGNQKYQYNHFHNNCSTKIRDYFDEALNGKVKVHSQEGKAERNFRDIVRENLNRPPIVSFALNITMNSKSDAPITPWQEMFYPPKLRENLMKVPAYDDAGNQILGRYLLEEGKVLVKGIPHPSSPNNFFQVVFVVFLAFFFLGFTLEKKTGDRSQKVGAFINGFLISFWGIHAGLLGTLMLITWFFSGHQDLWHNANLFVFWPTDLILVYFAAKAQKNKSPEFFKKPWVRGYIYAHFGSFALYTLISLAGIMSQDVANTMIYLMPISIISMLYLLRFHVLRK